MVTPKTVTSKFKVGDEVRDMAGEVGVVKRVLPRLPGLRVEYEVRFGFLEVVYLLRRYEDELEAV